MIPLLVVNAAELSFDASSLVKDLVVFIDEDVTPVRDFDSLLDILEDGQRLALTIVNHELREAESFDIFERSILNKFLLLLSGSIRGEEQNNRRGMIYLHLLALRWIH